MFYTKTLQEHWCRKSKSVLQHAHGCDLAHHLFPTRNRKHFVAFEAGKKQLLRCPAHVVRTDLSNILQLTCNLVCGSSCSWLPLQFWRLIFPDTSRLMCRNFELLWHPQFNANPVPSSRWWDNSKEVLSGMFRV